MLDLALTEANAIGVDTTLAARVLRHLAEVALRQRNERLAQKLVAQLAEVTEAHARSAGRVMVGFNRRFAPFAMQMQAFLADRSEPFVAHYRVNAGAIPLNHWTQDPAVGGGRIIGEGCHFIDFLTYLVGQSPVRVEAQALPDGGRYRQDNALLTFSFPDGSLASISYLANGDKSFAKERVEVFCGGFARFIAILLQTGYINNRLFEDRRRLLEHAGLTDRQWAAQGGTPEAHLIVPEPKVGPQTPPPTQAFHRGVFVSRPRSTPISRSGHPGIGDRQFGGLGILPIACVLTGPHATAAPRGSARRHTRGQAVSGRRCRVRR